MLFERAGTNTELLLQITSDEPLVELGMESEVARKVLLLQLARVRAARTSLALASVASPLEEQAPWSRINGPGYCALLFRLARIS